MTEFDQIVESYCPLNWDHYYKGQNDKGKAAVSSTMSLWRPRGTFSKTSLPLGTD